MSWSRRLPSFILYQYGMLQHISADKRKVCGEWKILGGKLTGGEMKVYLGIDMTKDIFDYCAMDDALNILCRRSIKGSKNERIKELSDLIKTLKSTGT